MLTLGVNVPMNEELARVGADASPEVLARAREAYEGPWNFWKGYAPYARRWLYSR